MEALAEIGKPAIELLVGALSDADANVCKRAYIVLVAMDWRPSTVQELYAVRIVEERLAVRMDAATQAETTASPPCPKCNSNTTGPWQRGFGKRIAGGARGLIVGSLVGGTVAALGGGDMAGKVIASMGLMKGARKATGFYCETCGATWEGEGINIREEEIVRNPSHPLKDATVVRLIKKS